MPTKTAEIKKDKASRRSVQEQSKPAQTPGLMTLQRMAGNRATTRFVQDRLHPPQNSESIDIQRWAYCTPPRMSAQDCPPREPGEKRKARSGPMSFQTVQDNTSGEGGFLVVNFDIGSTAIKSSLYSDTAWKQFIKDIAKDGSQ